MSMHRSIFNRRLDYLDDLMKLWSLVRLSNSLHRKLSSSPNRSSLTRSTMESSLHQPRPVKDSRPDRQLRKFILYTYRLLNYLNTMKLLSNSLLECTTERPQALRLLRYWNEPNCIIPYVMGMSWRSQAFMALLCLSSPECYYIIPACLLEF
jgi:hypothetical protein